MMKHNTKKSIGIVSLACCMVTALILAFSHAGFVSAKGQQNKVVQGISYSEEDFTVTPDYSVFSDAWRYTPYAETIPTSVLKSKDITLYDPGRQEMKIRLDESNSGLLLKSVKTGHDAEGAKFALAEKQIGDFSMTFRGFSEESYRGMIQASSRSGNEYQEGDGLLFANNGSLFDSRFNPYLDMRGVGVRFISTSNPEKSFTVHLYGTEMYDITNVTARVEIGGEPINVDGRKGYGLRLGEKEAKPDFEFGYATRLNHVSFCNSTNGLTSFPVSLRFDKDKMCVYGTSYEEHLWSKGDDGVEYIENERLIRNLSNNKMSDDASGEDVVGADLKTLTSADFESGYKVEIVVEDMTANETPLTWAEYDETKEEIGVVYGDKIRERNYERSSNEEAGKHNFRDPYARHANIVLYNVNGHDMRIYDGFDVEERQFTCPASATVPTGGKVLNGLRYTARAKNEQAEGEHFSLDPAQFTDENGILNVKLGPTSTQYAPKVTTDDTKELWPTQDGLSGLANKNIALDPFSDVRQLSVTIKSKVDPSKGFKIYFTSRTFKRSAVSAHIEIFGENIMTQSGLRGIGSNKTGNDCLKYDNQTGSMGTFGMKANTVEGRYSWNSTKDVYPIFKFNPKTMEVSTFDYSWHTARKLDEQYKTTNGLTEPFKTLSSDDFAGGYDMEVTVEQMNTKWNRGLKTWKQWNKGTPSDFTYAYDPASDGVHILENEYDRPCVIDVFTFTNGKTVTDKGFDVIIHNGGDLIKKTVKTGETVNLADVALADKQGCKLLGYSKTIDGTTIDFKVDDVVKEGCDLYPVYVPGLLNSMSISLNGDIAVNFYAEFPVDTKSVTADMSIVGKAPVKVEGKKVNDSGMWKFSYAIAAKEYKEKVSIHFINVDGKAIDGTTAEYSVKDYANSVNADIDAGKELKDLTFALIDYCEASRIYFAGETAVAIAKELPDMTAYKAVVSGTDNTVEVMGISLVLESKVKIRVYFRYNGENVESIADSPVAVANTNGIYYVESEVAAFELCTAKNFRIGGYNVGCSAYSYIASAVTNDPTSISYVNVLKTMYEYGQKAIAYKNIK